MKFVLIIVAALSVLIVGCGTDDSPTPITRTPLPSYIPVLEQPGPGVVTSEFTLPSANGGIVRLSDYRGSQPLAVVFYRGLF